MSRVAFVTESRLPEGSDEDELVSAILTPRGIDVVHTVWDDASVDWTAFASVVIRSPWDYYTKADAFCAWLTSLDVAGANLWNRPRTVLDNVHKRYLVDFAARGLPVVPTVCVPRGSDRDLRRVLADNGWTSAVIKPAISAGAHLTWRTSIEAATGDQARFAAQAADADTLVQPFMPSIATRGEVSLVFIEGRYSHAVVKRPRADDFRVQTQHGGVADAWHPTDAIVEQAAAVLREVAAPLLHARVDGVLEEDRFVLMELEINEPYLFLSHAPDAATRFADAIQHTCAVSP
ncbi:MAG: hypothetical protein IT182_07445 [Acidobacteria bacterium]|nr:hypothetical protein [Acidobacteriota bacterium]